MANKKGNQDAKRNEVEAKIRRPKSLEMKLAGISYREIGNRLGISHEQARKDVMTLIAQNVNLEHVEELRELENERLDMLWNRWFPRAMGRTSEDGTKSEPDLQAAKYCRELLQRRARLNGLDAPQTHRIEGGEGFGQVLIQITNIVENLQVEDLRKLAYGESKRKNGKSV